MLLGDGSWISMGVEVAFRRHVLKTNPIAGFDQFVARADDLQFAASDAQL